MQTIDLENYRIYVGEIWAPLQEFLDRHSYSQNIILVDENTVQHCLPLLQEHIDLSSANIIQIKAGEIHKNIETCSQIWQQLMYFNADRKALFINVGGGVIGDMGGFCASTFKRGIDFIQIPTTLLSNVDSSIGGKLGIDFAAVKNSVGVFNNPRAVFIDPVFLKTLPERELRSGMAEMIKHGLIADAEHWQSLRAIKDVQQVAWADFIVPSLLIKKNIVEQDPYEQGIRKALNFGHTIGHALESYALESPNPLLHGEAIGLGMICEAYLSASHKGLPQVDLKEISTYILEIFGKYPLKNEYFEKYLRLMKNDKKNEDRKVNFTLLSAVGKASINQESTEALIRESLAYYEQL